MGVALDESCEPEDLADLVYVFTQKNVTVVSFTIIFAGSRDTVVVIEESLRSTEYIGILYKTRSGLL